MATNTTNYNLVKPDTTDKVNISQINGNMDILDTQLKAVDNAKQPLLTFDDYPTYQSTNPVTSGGIYTALEDKQDTLTYDLTPTANSQNSLLSGAVYNALAKQATLSAQGNQETYTFKAGYFPAIKTGDKKAYASVAMPKYSNATGWTIQPASTTDIVIIDSSGIEYAVSSIDLDFVGGFAGNFSITTSDSLPNTPIALKFKANINFTNYGRG